jgi:glycerol-3-phosphate acyltransferase PlsY
MMVFTRIVSLSSISSAIIFPLEAIFIFEVKSVPLIVLAICIAIFVPFTHRENMKRLLKGTEKKFDFGKNRLK